MNNIVINIFKMSMFSSIIILIVMGIRRLFRGRLHLKIISLMWILVLARLLIPFTLTSPVNIGNVLFNDVADTQIEAVEVLNQSLLNDIDNNIMEVESSNTYLSEQSRSEQISNEYDATDTNTQSEAEVSISLFEKCLFFLKSISLMTYLFIIWLVGVCIILTGNICRMISFCRKANTYKRPLRYNIRQVLYKNKAVLGIKRNVELIVSDHIDVPVTFGFIKPKILISEKLMTTLDNKKIELIIMHELCHIKRWDIAKTYIWILARAVHWFNPLVRLAFKMYQNDIEFACDNMVTSKLNNQKRIEYSQSLLDVIRVSQYSIKAPFAAPFCKKKSITRERIMNMLKPQKKSKSAGLISLLLVMILLITCFTTACQPTPEESVVQNKADDDLEEAIAQTASPVTSQTQESVIEEHIIETDTNSSNTVTVNIDADVTTPNISIPVAQVEETTILADQIEQIVKAFYGETTLYDVVQTKEDIQATILNLQLMLTDDEALLNSSTADATGSTDLEYLRSLVNEKIEELQESLEDAPDEKSEIDSYDSALTKSGLIACVDIGKDYMGYVEADVSDSFGQSIYLYAFGGDYSTSNRTLEYEFSTSIELDNSDAEFQNAKQMAETMIEDMGIEGVTLGEVYLSEDNTGLGIISDREFYVFCFERAVGEGSVDFNFVSTMSNTNEYDTEEYDRVLPYETIQIWIEGDEIRQFTWKVPMEVMEIINDNVALATDYEQAIELMKQQAFVQFVDVEDERGDLFSASEIDIDSIDLELVRIREQDTGNYLIVPAWVFHGQVNSVVTQLYIDMMGTKDVEVGDSIPADNFWLSGDTIMTINALDGSIIDIEVGY